MKKILFLCRLVDVTESGSQFIPMIGDNYLLKVPTEIPFFNGKRK